LQTISLNLKKASLFALFFYLSIFQSGLTSGCKEDVNNPGSQKSANVYFWVTSPSQDKYFIQEKSLKPLAPNNEFESIIVDPSTQYQEIDGFGFALTGGSAYHIHNMSGTKRKELLTELFDYGVNNIGTSYLRVSIGASDLDAEVFSYDDLPYGQTDPEMEHFSLEEDKKHVIPVLKEILEIFPDIKILGSPWSPPVWMKTNKNSVGGSLLPQYYDAYAKYFVKYVQEMEKEGITIDAITVQNEPLHPGNNPSLLMLAEDQSEFIKKSLGPAFQNAGIKTKIIVYDHNPDRYDYAITVLNDPETRQYVDGSAFHLYGGDINSLSLVNYAHPDKNLYFTEQWVGAGANFAGTLRWHIREIVIGATRNWCRNVIEWNLAADENQDPHTPGGCDRCLGAITIEGDAVTRNPAYYIIAHASKFVRPGSRRIESSLPNDLPNAAFETPDGSIVVIVLNYGNSSKSFNLFIGEKVVVPTLAAGAVGTFILRGG